MLSGLRFSPAMTGPRNLITDVAGLTVGNAHDDRLASGVTVALFDEPAVASCAVLGGAPGTRETDLLEPDKLVQAVHAIVLSGGSAYGLDAASGVQAFLREKGVGFQVGPRGYRSCRRPWCSTSSMAATRTGGAIRPIANSATRRPAVPRPILPLAPPAAASAPRRPA